MIYKGTINIGDNFNTFMFGMVKVLDRYVSVTNPSIVVYMVQEIDKVTTYLCSEEELRDVFEE